jgi:hypothetical protein
LVVQRLAKGRARHARAAVLIDNKRIDACAPVREG